MNRLNSRGWGWVRVLPYDGGQGFDVQMRWFTSQVSLEMDRFSGHVSLDMGHISGTSP